MIYNSLVNVSEGEVIIKFIKSIQYISIFTSVDGDIERINESSVV